MTERTGSASGSRSSRRVSAVLKVRYRNAGQFLVSYCTNLSRGGLFVSTSSPTRAGKLITLALEVPGLDEPAMLSARVCWTRPTSDEFGPAGMGLRFEQIEEVIGAHIDALTTNMEPLQIGLVGRPPAAWSHLAALLESMVYCTTQDFDTKSTSDDDLAACDLVVIDITAKPELTIELLERLAARGDTAPPALALCGPAAADAIPRVSRVAQVVTIPIDTAGLQDKILEALGRVCATR
ncbi:MAG: TIGR02266 family protein [Nannocystaceae bacterium]